MSYLKTYCGGLSKEGLARQYLSGTVYAPSTTHNSIRSVFRQPVSIFVGHKGLMNAIGSNTFTARDLTNERTAVFIISPDETHVFGSVVVSVLNQLMSGLITIAQSEYKGKLPHRVDFVFDEMGNLPARIPDIDALVSAARSRNVRFHFVLQSSEQLSHVYGQQLASVILDNCDTWAYMGTKSLDFLERLSRLCGDVQMMSGQTERLLPVSTLQRLEKRRHETETMLRVASLKPYVTPLLDIGLYETPAEVAMEPRVHESCARPIFRMEEHVHEVVKEAERILAQEAGIEPDSLAETKAAAEKADPVGQSSAVEKPTSTKRPEDLDDINFDIELDSCVKEARAAEQELEQAIGVLEADGSAGKKYEAVSVVLNYRHMLSSSQRDRIVKLCNKGDESGLSYKQRMLLLDCAE